MPCHYMCCMECIYTQCVKHTRISNNGTSPVATHIHTQHSCSVPFAAWFVMPKKVEMEILYGAFSRDLAKSGISVSLIVAVVVMSIKCRFAILLSFFLLHPPSPNSLFHFSVDFSLFFTEPIPSDYRQANTIPFIKIRFHRWMFYIYAIVLCV